MKIISFFLCLNLYILKKIINEKMHCVDLLYAVTFKLIKFSYKPKTFYCAPPHHIIIMYCPVSTLQ